MPYIIKKFNNMYRVCKKSNPSVCFSNKGLSKKMAIKQRIAIQLSGRSQMILLGSYNGIPYAPLS